MSCQHRIKINYDDEIIEIYSRVIDKCTGLERTQWYDKEKIPTAFSKGDSPQIYLQYKDSIKAILKKKIFYVKIDDTTISMEDEMKELKDSCIRSKFFKQYFDNDSNFIDLILKWQPSKNKREIIPTDKLRPSFNYQISTKVFSNEKYYLLTSLKLSNVFIDTNHSQAIVYTEQKGGIFFFLAKVKKKWVVKNQLMTWSLID